MTIREKILVIEDEKSISHFICTVLNNNGYEAMQAQTGEEALSMISSHCPDLIILDLGLPDMDGLDILRNLRSWTSLPVVVVSARSHERDKVAALDLGADDYLTKPFVLEELVARIQAHLRRQMRSDPRRASAGPIQIGGIRMEPEEMRVTRNGVEVPLSTREFELLAYLMQNAGQTLSRERIFHDVWRTEYGDVGTVAINIKNLRAKLDPDWRYIKTVWGSGYRFVTQNGFAEEESDDRRS